MQPHHITSCHDTPYHHHITPKHKSKHKFGMDQKCMESSKSVLGGV
jgi:hypothetical protein